MGEERPAIRISKTRVSIVAAATPTVIYQVTTGRTAKFMKLLVYSGQAADILLEIGEMVAAVFTRRLPRLRCIAGMNLNVGELELPAFEFETDIYGQASAAAAAPNDVEVMVEVEEIG